MSLPVIAASCNNTQNQTNNNEKKNPEKLNQDKNKSNEIAVLKVWKWKFQR
ncbi:hypothetical protein [Mycoplasmopsis agalactiae]|uniref:hypothetical protein n=1 Tax=Mycoplasmopsis agalactiae TaxID=2110 RepID=UPI0032EC2E4F